MKLRRFCAKCGKEIQNTENINEGFLCDNCYGKEITPYILLDHIQLRSCVFCNAFSIRYDDRETKWVYKPEDENDLDFITRILFENIYFKLEKKQNLTYNLFLPSDVKSSQTEDIEVQIEVSGDNSQHFLDGTMLIKLRKIHCPHCAKKQGGRFDAIVQIRIQHEQNEGRLAEVMKAVQEIEKTANFENLHNFISILEKTTNGYDLKVSTNSMARTLESKLRARFPFEVKRSKRLMGIDLEKGSRLYRHSILLRLVPVERGDRIILDGLEFLIKNITKKKIILQNIHTDKIQQENFDVFQKKKWHYRNASES